MDSWSTYQNLPPDQVNWADLAQRWMAMRSAQDEQRPGGELNGYGGHFGSDVGPPPSHFGRGGGYEYGRGDPGGLYHHGHDQNYPRGPPERNHRDYELHDTFRQDDWSSPPSGPNRPIFPSAAQTKGDIRNDFQDNYRGDWGAVPPPPPCPRDPPELYRPPGPASNQYFQHDFPPCPSPSARNWGSQHPPGPPIRGGPPVGAPPLPNGPPLHGLPPSAGPPLKSSSPSGGPPPSGGSGPGPWYPTPFYPPPFTSGVSNNNISSQHQSGSSQSSAPSFFTMDASARKKLPAWILEGLEKAEREKMKQLEKEERMKRAEEERAKRRVLAGKGRFDSSSEDEDDGQADDERSRTKSRQSCDANDDDGEPVFLARRANPPVEDLRTDEEKRDDAMATVKFIMMSLLMEATDEALHSCISESIREMKHEAEPKLLAKSSALAALSTLGGGDESDDETDGDDEKEGAVDKSRNGGASPSSESGDENSTVFKTPLGVPRKTSKQTTTSAEDPSTEAVSAGDGMESVKANLRRSGRNESDKTSNNVKSSDDTDSKRRRRSRSRERRRSRSGDRRRRSSRERRRSSSRNRSSRRSKSRERRRSRSPPSRSDRRRSRSRDRKRSRERRRSRSGDRKRHCRERSAEGRRDRSTSRERRRR